MEIKRIESPASISQAPFFQSSLQAGTSNRRRRRLEKIDLVWLARTVFGPRMTDAQIQQEILAHHGRLIKDYLEKLVETNDLIIAQSPRREELPHIHTAEALGYFFDVKTGLKDSTVQSNRKRLKPFAAEFQELPLEGEIIRKRYLARFKDHAPRYQRNIYDVLDDFYNTIKSHFHLPLNPMDEIKRPEAGGTGNIEPHPLNEKWLLGLFSAAQTDTEMAALHAELGAGWRPCAFLRLEAVDVREALYRESPIILCHDKERAELTPILPETLQLLSRLTPSDLGDHDPIIRSRRVYRGVRQPMGMKAHTNMIYGLYRRANIPDSFVPYDLRDTFGTVVIKYSRDWFLTERLLHHVIPGEGRRYAQYPLDQLCRDLEEFSPLRRLQPVPPFQARKGGQKLKLNGEGGTRTPMHCCTRS
jgi:integrase